MGDKMPGLTSSASYWVGLGSAERRMEQAWPSVHPAQSIGPNVPGPQNRAKSSGAPTSQLNPESTVRVPLGTWALHGRSEGQLCKCLSRGTGYGLTGGWS